MKKMIFSLLMLVSVSASAATNVQTAPAGGMLANKYVNKSSVDGLAPNADDVIIGDLNAPVQMIGYVSLTCPHCAIFHNKSYPLIKKNYVDNGKVVFIWRLMPLDPIAMGFSEISYCGRDKGLSQQADFIDYTFKHQEELFTSKDLYQSAIDFAGLSTDLSGKDIDKCIKSGKYKGKVENTMKVAKKIGVEGTPIFFINGEKYSGEGNYRTFQKLLDKKLDEAMSKK